MRVRTTDRPAGYTGMCKLLLLSMKPLLRPGWQQVLVSFSVEYKQLAICTLSDTLLANMEKH